MNDHRAVLRAAQRLGATVERRRSGHVRLTLPDGTFITTASSPSDPNAGKALRRDLKRAGLDLGGAR